MIEKDKSEISDSEESKVYIDINHKVNKNINKNNNLYIYYFYRLLDRERLI